MATFNVVEAKIGSILRGVRQDFDEVYRPLIREADISLQGVMDLSKPSDGRLERYAYPEAPPNITRWDYGKEIPRGTFRYRSWTVTNFRWGKAIDFNADDEEDDQLRTLRSQAMDLGVRAAMIPQRVAFQVLTGGAADPDLLPALPLAPDGVGVYSATDGAGANRFGTANGNIVSQSGVTGAAVRTDIFSTFARIRQFKDQAGRRRWPAQIVDKGFVVYGSPDMEQALREAFQQPITADRGVAAGVSNVFVVAGIPIEIRVTAEFTGNNLFVFLKGAKFPPLFQQVRLPARIYTADETNSDRGRDFDMRAVYAKFRAGYGVAPCDGTVKIA